MLPQIRCLIPLRIESSIISIDHNITDNIDRKVPIFITSYQVHRETKPKQILTRHFKSFVQDNFKHDLQCVYWEYTLDIYLHDANHSFEQFLVKKIINILDKHAPLKYMSRKQPKNISKKVYFNQSKSKPHCTINFARPKIINQNLIFITNSKNTTILS